MRVLLKKHIKKVYFVLLIAIISVSGISENYSVYKNGDSKIILLDNKSFNTISSRKNNLFYFGKKDMMEFYKSYGNETNKKENSWAIFIHKKDTLAIVRIYKNSIGDLEGFLYHGIRSSSLEDDEIWIKVRYRLRNGVFQAYYPQYMVRPTNCQKIQKIQKILKQNYKNLRGQEELGYLLKGLFTSVLHNQECKKYIKELLKSPNAKRFEKDFKDYKKLLMLSGLDVWE